MINKYSHLCVLLFAACFLAGTTITYAEDAREILERAYERQVTITYQYIEAGGMTISAEKNVKGSIRLKVSQYQAPDGTVYRLEEWIDSESQMNSPIYESEKTYYNKEGCTTVLNCCDGKIRAYRRPGGKNRKKIYDGSRFSVTNSTIFGRTCWLVKEITKSKWVSEYYVDKETYLILAERTVNEKGAIVFQVHKESLQLNPVFEPGFFDLPPKKMIYYFANNDEELANIKNNPDEKIKRYVKKLDEIKARRTKEKKAVENKITRQKLVYRIESCMRRSHYYLIPVAFAAIASIVILKRRNSK